MRRRPAWDGVALRVVVALAASLCSLVVAGPDVLSVAPAQAATVEASQPTSVDQSFGGGLVARRLSELDDRATGVAVQPDGGVVVVGTTAADGEFGPPDLFVARFSSSVELDPRFGSGGVTVIGAPGQWDTANAVALQRDGMIVVGGRVDSRPVVLRLTGSGALDPGFQGGIAPIQPQGAEVAALAVQPDGGI